jgi:hypothetical protein
MKKNRFRAFIPVLLIFVILNGMFITGRPWLRRLDADQDVVIIGNVLLFLITLASYAIAQKGLNHPNPHAFVRSVYSGLMIKLFVCIIAAFLYISAFRANVNKAALFTCMGLYLLYSFVEVSILMKQLKRKTHG